eukprot:2548774-Rhodomonas_salina.2
MTASMNCGTRSGCIPSGCGVPPRSATFEVRDQTARSKCEGKRGMPPWFCRRRRLRFVQDDCGIEVIRAINA